jgi:hypothetical protein
LKLASSNGVTGTVIVPQVAGVVQPPSPRIKYCVFGATGVTLTVFAVVVATKVPPQDPV